MGYMTDGLSFNTLRGGLEQRLNEICERLGAGKYIPQHQNTVSGLQHLVKMISRIVTILSETSIEMTEDARAELAGQLAGAVITLDTIAYDMDVDLGAAVMEVFNHDEGSAVYLDAEDWHYRPRRAPWEQS